jgi:3-hydroxy acid dehydrogenase / malonic semialdehyde reductase
MGLLKDKIVLVTGASSGIGKACAFDFAREGARLIVAARRRDKLKELATELKKEFDTECRLLTIDIRNQKEVEAEFNSLPVEWKDVDILINNAGLAKGLSKIHEADISHWEEMIDTNLKGLLYITRLVTPYMVKRGSGHIINIGSTAGHEVYVNGNVYCATKFAVKALGQSIRVDLLDKNIKVTSVDPGMVLTEFANVRFSGDEEKAKEVYKGITPLTPGDVSQAVMFAATRPSNVNINEIIITPAAQASSTQVYRKQT